MIPRAFWKYPNNTKSFGAIKQAFQYLLVLDFEATCEKNKQLVPQEIIEFPCIVVSTQDWKIKDVFHEYVKPKVHPNLSPFCTDLTGIMQEMVNDQPHFPEIFAKFCSWLKSGSYFIEGSNKSAFVTCGNWDLRVMLPNQCALDKIPLPKEFQQWIDLKQTFCDSTDHYPRGLLDMLFRLQLPVQGRLHSGINDTENMVRIIKTLSETRNVQFQITSKLDEPLKLI